MDTDFGGTDLLAPLRDTGDAPPPSYDLARAAGRARSLRARRRGLVGALTVLAIAAAWLLPKVVWPSAQQAPFSPGSIHLTGRLWESNYDEAKAIVAPGQILPPAPGGKLIAGQITWTPPRTTTDGWFTVYLIDERTKLRPGIIYGNDRPGATHDVWYGSDGSDGLAAARYPWLEGIGPVSLGGNRSRTSGIDVFVNPARGELSLVVPFEPGGEYQGVTVVDPPAVSDLRLAVVYFGPDRTIYWAARLAG